MIQSFVVRLSKEQTYRHLHTLCQNDTLFAIIDHGDKWEDKDFESIVIFDQQAPKAGARRAAVGTVRLLPHDKGTALIFVNKDAYWHQEIVESGEKLFSDFRERAREHFEKLGLLVQETAEPQETVKRMKEVPPGREQSMIWKIVIAIFLLGIALAGFIQLPGYSATLWLIFLVVAYPVALAFTAAGQSMNNRNLVEIYKAGLTQVPIIGKLFSRKP
jgi:hypothetical protein